MPLPTDTGVAEPTSISPCSNACPLGINVQRYVGLIQRGLLVEALDVIAEQCPLPGVCGALCQRPCEAACRRSERDRPVAIRELKRAAARAALASAATRRHDQRRPGPWKVAIIGAGPAGLAAARSLAELGHRVTLLERRPRAGGLLDEVVPEFRMPRRLLRADIAAILSHPLIELRTGVEVGRDGAALAELAGGGYAAVVVSTGAGVEDSAPSRWPDSTLTSLELLRRAAADRLPEPRGAALVAGNTAAAVAAARTLIRAGWPEVTLVASRPLERWPADPADLAAARAEGVTFRDRTRIEEFQEPEGRAVVALGRTSEDGAGHHRPFELAAQLLVAETPRRPEVDALSREPSLGLTPRGAFEVDPFTTATTSPGVFAAGECATGPKTVVEALASGKRAALMTDRYLGGRPLDAELPRRSRPWFELVVQEDLSASSRLDALAREEKASIETPLEAAEEASRCLRCGPCGECDRCMPDCLHERVVADRDGVPVIVRAPAGAARDDAILAVRVDPDRCTGCGRCEAICPHQAVVVRFRLAPRGERVRAQVSRPACRGCGRCVPACPFGALELSPGRHDTRMLWAAISEQVVGR